MVTGKGSAGGVGTVHTGGESDYAQPGPVITERGHRSCKIAGIFCTDLVEKTRQPGALTALDIKLGINFWHRIFIIILINSIM